MEVMRRGAGVYAATGARIAGTGGHLPGRPVGNDEVVRLLPDGATTPEWIAEHTGIEQRHWADPGEATSDLAAAAGALALEAAGIDATALDHILLCSTTADWTSPAAASRVQHLLGAHCPAEDKQVACASWLFGLDHAARLCATGARAVLVVGADVKSRFVSNDDHRLRPVMADGAGAVVLVPGPEVDDGDGLRSVHLYSDGSRARNIFTPAGGSAVPASEESVRDGLHYVRMAVPGGTIKADAIAIMSDGVHRVLADTGWTLDDIDLFIGHQANLAILRGLADELGLDMGRFPVTIDRTGNTVAATLPFTLDDAVRSGRVRPGDRVVFTTAGAGYAGGAAAYRVPS
ncbi:MAG: 3-oxoacyl-ACP synthase III family protein [Microthrixaceae bacterium]